MHYTIFYFSGTGNTWLMGEYIKNRIEEFGHEASLYSIETIDFNKLKDLVEASDHLIIGYPIYGSEAPKPMKSFIKNLPILEEEIKLSVYCTQAFASGDGANYLQADFKAKNYSLEQTQEFNLSNNFYIPIFIRAFKVGDQHKIDKRNEMAYKKAEVFIHNILNKKVDVKRIGFFNRMIGEFQRREVDNLIRKVNDALLVDESCVNCGMCIKLCPVKNIYQENETITIGNQCIACMRCYQACPISAIQIGQASRDTVKYPRYKGPIRDFDFYTMKK